MEYNSIEEHNRIIKETSGISTINLPSVFAIWGDNHYAVIITTHFSELHPVFVYKFSITPCVKELLGEGKCLYSMEDKWLQYSSHKIIVECPNILPSVHNKFYTTNITYENYLLQLKSGEQIPVLKLDNPYMSLGKQFMNFEEDNPMIYHFKLIPLEPFSYPSRDPIRSPLPFRYTRRQTEANILVEQSAYSYLNRAITILESIKDDISNEGSIKSTFPQHIVNGYIDSVLQKKELCPITFQELEKTTSCITPCGHAASYEAAKHWIIKKNTCPVCRNTCLPSQLQKWQ